MNIINLVDSYQKPILRIESSGRIMLEDCATADVSWITKQDLDQILQSYRKVFQYNAPSGAGFDSYEKFTLVKRNAN